MGLIDPLAIIPGLLQVWGEGSNTPGLVAFETVTINADGKFCTLAYPIPANHDGEFKAEIGDKSDNYRVSCERGCPDADSDWDS